MLFFKALTLEKTSAVDSKKVKNGPNFVKNVHALRKYSSNRLRQKLCPCIFKEGNNIAHV